MTRARDYNTDDNARITGASDNTDCNINADQRPSGPRTLISCWDFNPLMSLGSSEHNLIFHQAWNNTGAQTETDKAKQIYKRAYKQTEPCVTQNHMSLKAYSNG